MNTYTIQVVAEAHAPLDRHASSALLGGRGSTDCHHLLESRCTSLREAAQGMIKRTHGSISGTVRQTLGEITEMWRSDWGWKLRVSPGLGKARSRHELLCQPRWKTDFTGCSGVATLMFSHLVFGLAWFPSFRVAWLDSSALTWCWSSWWVWGGQNLLPFSKWKCLLGLGGAPLLCNDSEAEEKKKAEELKFIGQS